ncbi:MAG TPA: amidohydrolase family protein, partial [Agriterribacter sp.]|nr:amidohydrolase family protein [Agriterribacter sp.]
MRISLFLALLCWVVCTPPAQARQLQQEQILLENVRIFNGTSPTVTAPVNVLVSGNIIQTISAAPVTVSPGVTKIDGAGRTLMPGLIDVHVHMAFGALTMQDMMSPDLSENTMLEKVSISAAKMLMRGFTSVRDVGGPIFPLKAAIDGGKITGPRIWPSGAVISQTAGHGDFRTPAERSRRFFGEPSRAEQYGATFIADGRDEVLTAVREN